MFLTAKGAKSVRKGRKVFIYRRNFAFFGDSFLLNVYMLPKYHLISFSMRPADE
jgi:hypothetical protein